MANLTLRNIKKSFGAVDVIHGVDLDIASGEFVVFVGPSGCGKSTLLRMICGLDTVSAGDITIDGRRVNDVAAAQRGLALVFQSYALYPHMTVRQNMAFGLENLKTSKAEIEARISEAARALRLEPYLHRRPTALSGGQRQRVAIGRAIVREPKIFLFDEPLSNLDAELRVSMRAELTQLHRRLGATMIYVTHDQVEAMTMAQKIVVLRAGRIEQVGPPLELYNHPANQFVAGFIGSPRMNFLPGRVRETGADGVVVEVEGLGLITAGRRPGLTVGDPVTLGIRPEHMLQDSDGITVPVTAVEQLGGLSYVRLAKHDLVVQIAGQTELVPDSTVALRLPPDRLHVFTQTGAAIPAASQTAALAAVA
jgi:multiple sugar transport system ATP-binding protein